jgi:hypothetical protein
MPWMYKLIENETGTQVNTITIKDHASMVEMLEMAEMLNYHMELDYFKGEE